MQAQLHAQITDPADLSGLVLWVDANDVSGTGSQPANGAAVTTWADKSGAGHHLTAAAAAAPTFETVGFDGINPALRFPVATKMSGPNLFGTTYQPEVTIFFVLMHVTRSNNFVLNLNGDNWSSDPANGRFSFHAPWSNTIAYFDAGACCGATRVYGPFPNASDETTLFSAVNNQPGASQFFRIDGNPLASDSSAIAPRVTGGIRIGNTSGHNFNGRFAEIVVYNRTLSMAEIQDVECYLLNKWKPLAMQSECLPDVSVLKSSATWSEGTAMPLAAPDNDILYSITVSRGSGVPVSDDSLFIVDQIPNAMEFYNGDVDGASGPQTDPVAFVDSSSGLSWNYPTDVAYSNGAATPASMADCTYTPSAGYDPNVTHICVNPKGPFVGTNTSFELQFRAKIK